VTLTRPAPPRPGPARAPGAASPGREVARWAALGLLVLVALVLVDLARTGGHPVGLVQAGARGPAVAAFRADFPDLELPDGVGLDGQMVYATARDPWPVDASAPHLDRPRYRLQRPLLPWTASLLHPGGGGTGLVWALFAVGLAGVAAGAVAAGRLSVGWGGPPWVAALVPLLPGAWWALRVSTPDVLAVGLALLAVHLASRGRTALAVALGVAAVLAKEPALLILVGWALGQRTARSTVVAAVPAAVAAGWMVALRLLVPGAEGLNGDIGLPLVGLARAATGIWFEGRELIGLASTLGTLALGGLALARRGLRHPLGAAVALHLAFLVVSGPNPLGTNFGGTRTTLALATLALLALATPAAPPVRPVALPGSRRVSPPDGARAAAP